MAASVALSVSVIAGPEQIFDALTRSTGLASIWFGDTQAEPLAGSVIRMRHDPVGLQLDFRLDELQPCRRIAWTPLNDLRQAPVWTGRTVTWDLMPQQGGTEVLLQQGPWPDGTTQTDLARLTYLWSQVLRRLKGYVETGTPQPVFPPRAGAMAR
jgi:uncharacterized protein YndB with AHSA1/START domain